MHCPLRTMLLDCGTWCVSAADMQGHMCRTCMHMQGPGCPAGVAWPLDDTLLRCVWKHDWSGVPTRACWAWG
jgi:hypothetical protein